MAAKPSQLHNPNGHSFLIEVFMSSNISKAESELKDYYLPF